MPVIACIVIVWLSCFDLAVKPPQYAHRHFTLRMILYVGLYTIREDTSAA